MGKSETARKREGESEREGGRAGEREAAVRQHQMDFMSRYTNVPRN